MGSAHRRHGTPEPPALPAHGTSAQHSSSTHCALPDFGDGGPADPERPSANRRKDTRVTLFRTARGATVLAIRHARGLTMDTTAAAAKITGGYLSKIERGKANPRSDVTARLAEALDVEPEVLTGQKPAIGTLRTILGYDQAAFARDIGISHGRLDRIERGIEIPPPDLLAVIAARLGVAVEALDARSVVAA